MNKNYLLLILLITSFFSFKITAQENITKNFQYLISSGDVPTDFRMLSQEKFEIDKTGINRNEKRSIRKTREQFLLESNFAIDGLLLSGSVLFNDPVSKYINKVADNVLKDHPDLREEIRFYVTKSPSVNAFSTDKGMIFINIGLIAQLSNEAQLAFILSHEIIHYTEKHNMDIFVEKYKISEGKDNYKSLTWNDKILAKNNWSKEREREADEKGLNKFYSKSGYSLSAINGVFDVLQYSYLPFNEITFEKSFFETKNITFPKSYFLDEINQIKGDEDYDDSKSTHPNILKRRKKIFNIIENLDTEKSSEYYIVGKEEFLKIRQIARFESIRQQVRKMEYPQAIYNSFVLLKKYPDNLFLKRMLASSLYYISKYKTYGNIKSVLPNYKKIEGQSQQVFYFLKQLTDEEANILALQYAWDLKQQLPDDEYLNEICKDLFHDLVFKSKKKVYDFSRKTKEEKKESMNFNVKDSNNISKYDKIKMQKKLDDVGEKEWAKYAFVDILKNNEFVDLFEQTIEEKEKEEKENEDIDYNKKEKLSKEEKREKKLEEKYGKALGINKILILEPVYLIIDERKKQKKRFVDSENSLNRFYYNLEQNADASQIEIELLESKHLDIADIEKFNDIAILKEWLSEKYNHKHDNIVSSSYSYVQQIAEKYDIEHISWTGIISMRQDKTDAFVYLVYSACVPILIPWAIYYAVTPEYNTYYFNVLLNVKTGEPELNFTKNLKHKDTQDFLDSYIYDTFYQISKER
ncbi:MAG: M48 family metallopeptidase [Bacteroidota bacterium]|nr:M48 family metallopeptidase [Bacteroidota bacterium]